MSYEEALEFFGLKDGYTMEELRKKYHPMIRDIHPDANLDNTESATEKSKIINQAYTILKTALIKKTEKNREKDSSNLKEEFINRLKEVQKMYPTNKEVKNLCRYYLDLIQNVKTEEEIKIQTKEFEEKLAKIEEKMLFLSEKEKYKKKLINDAKYAKTDILRRIAMRFQEILEVTYTLEDLIQLEEEYKEYVKKIQLEEQEKMLDARKNAFKRVLETTKTKYLDEATINLVQAYEEKLKVIQAIREVDKIQKEFDAKFQKIRHQEKEIANLRLYLIGYFKHYQQKYNDPLYENIFSTYQNLLNEKNTLEGLRALELSFVDEMNKIRSAEEAKETKFLTMKDKIKRAAIYNFYRDSLDSSISKIVRNKELLEKVLSIIDTAKQEDIDFILKLVSKMDYKKPKSAKSAIELYMMAKEGKIKVSNKEEIYNVKTEEEEEEYQSDKISSLKEERDRIKEEILKGQYYYATNTNINDIFHSLNLLIDVLQMLENMPDDELISNYEVFSKINFKSMKDIKELLNMLKPSSKVFVSFKTGDICLLKEMKDQILVIPIDARKPYGFVKNEEVARNFISINEFFQKATFVNGGDVEEMINRYESHSTLYLHDRSYLYFYRNLMLEYYEPIYENSEPYFSFTTSDTRYGWKLRKGFFSTGEVYEKFKDREKCEEALMQQINVQIASLDEIEYGEDAKKI